MKKNIYQYFLNNSNNSFIQLIRYFLVGGICACINIFLLYLFVNIFKINYLISNILSFIFSLLLNYSLSKRYVFKTDSYLNQVTEIVMYFIIGILGMIFDTFILWLMTSKIKIYYLFSKFISTGMTFIWNFFARKLLYKNN